MLARITFAVFVTLLGLDLGAGLYETRVVVPHWEAAFVAGAAGTEAAFQIGREAGVRWWIGITPTLGLVALLALATAYRSAAPNRAWRLAASGLELVIVVTTLTYFAPTIVRLLDPARTVPGPQAAVELHTWMALNWGRAAATAAAWGASLRALS
jgi:hypothetical protein